MPAADLVYIYIDYSYLIYQVNNLIQLMREALPAKDKDIGY